MFQVDPQANYVLNLDKSPEWPWARYLAYLISFFCSLRKTFAVWGKAQNQERLIVHLSGPLGLSFLLQKYSWNSSKALGGQGSITALCEEHSPLWNSGIPLEKGWNVWCLNSLSFIPPPVTWCPSWTLDTPGTLNWIQILVILLNDRARYMDAYT